MLPRLGFTEKSSPLLFAFLKKLKASGYQGEINSDTGSRLLNAIDNSVYQILPQTVLTPRSPDDISRIFKLAKQPVFHSLNFTARGGGTGTNGQSLNTGIIIDCSKYLTKILELNLQQGWVKVQPGVVLDQLNEYLKPHGVFFAPTLSPSNRATLGGMTNTDACGKGSILYGKTSEHVLAITAVYSDGSIHTSQRIEQQTLQQLKQQTDLIGEIYRQVDDTVCRCQKKIAAQFPKLTRFMTGYNLAHVYRDDKQHFNLNAIITGSEGTLNVITELKLKLTPLPKYKYLAVLQYDSFQNALQHAKQLLAVKPAAIETIDHTILELAKTDLIYNKVKTYVNSPDKITRGINLVEFVGDDEVALTTQIDELKQILANDSTSFAYNITNDTNEIANLWILRKKSVGLLGKVKGKRKPVSGVEDTVVPPERLADYIKEFRALLDSKGLTYGMFGHVDAGCLHVRPALNLDNPNDEALYYEISEAVAKLTQKYGGLMWGEHGKGYRSQYVPMFFGPELYTELRKIKQSFDPYNQLNPGKIATPIDSDSKIVNLTATKRASFNRQITEKLKTDYEIALNCNGNGACFNYSTKAVMCPSYKVTRDRRYSPKGRASLIREWLRLLSISTNRPMLKLRWLNTLKKKLGNYDFSNEVYDSMHECLSCKACATECPVNVDVPSFKAHFLKHYHTRYLRSPRDWLVALAERSAYYQQKTPRLWNLILKQSLSKFVLKNFFKLVDTPLLNSPNLNKLRKQQQLPIVSLHQLQQLSPQQKQHAVVIIQDWLTSFYQTNLLIKTNQLLSKLGYQVYILEWFENGKPLHVKGMLQKFKQIATRNAKTLNVIKQLNLPMVGIEPSITLTYRHEYVETLGALDFEVQLIQEFLSSNEFPKQTKMNTQQKTFTLLMHCTEQTANASTRQAWQQVFSKLGLSLEIPETGCCGMAGLYGHEAEHQTNSQRLYQMSWQPLIKQGVLISGISCRTQVNRLSANQTMHPIDLLVNLFTSEDWQ